MEYIYLVIASIAFASQFMFTKKYQKTIGEATLGASFFNKMISPIVFVFILLCLNGFQLSVTPFSLILAIVNVAILLSLAIASLKALSSGSIANYSLYLLSGGMLLPVFYGFIFGGDSIGVWKILSILFILGAIFIKLDTKEKITKKKMLLCFLLFLFNGWVGGVSSIYQDKAISFARPPARDFQILYTLLSMLAATILFAIEAVRKEEIRKNVKAYLKASPWSLGEGLLNGTGNLLLLLSLKVLEPSLQYPIITGGSIFLAAVFGLLFKEKITTRGWISVGFAVVGTVFMVF